MSRIKEIKYIKTLTSEDLLDINLIIKSNQIQRFAINYRANIKKEWYEIYRVDNYHGYLHEIKFWRSSKQIMIKNNRPLKTIFNHYIDEIINNFQNYREYFEEALEKKRIKRKWEK